MCYCVIVLLCNSVKVLVLVTRQHLLPDDRYVVEFDHAAVLVLPAAPVALVVAVAKQIVPVWLRIKDNYQPVLLPYFFIVIVQSGRGEVADLSRS